jgi:hypothetical protein
MQNLQYSAALQATIQWLENEQSTKGTALKEQAQEALDTLKPINLLKSSVREVIASANSMDDLIGPMAGLIAGNLVKQVVVQKSQNETRQVIGSVLQLGVTNIIVQHPQEVKIVGKALFQLFFGPRKPRVAQP